MLSMSWVGDWAWALPLIVFTLILHVTGLACINKTLARVVGEAGSHRNFWLFFVLVLGRRRAHRAAAVRPDHGVSLRPPTARFWPVELKRAERPTPRADRHGS